jgi:hypothetical protein
MALGMDRVYLANAMKLCRYGFNEGDYFVFLQLFTEPFSRILSE